MSKSLAKMKETSVNSGRFSFTKNSIVHAHKSSSKYVYFRKRKLPGSGKILFMNILMRFKILWTKKIDFYQGHMANSMFFHDMLDNGQQEEQH